MAELQPVAVRGAALVDGGASRRPMRSDLLLSGSRIEAIGPHLTAPTGAIEIDATGLTAVPGFVDVHSHDDVAALKAGFQDPKLRQGVTTVVVGNCGHGCAPQLPAQLRSYSVPVLGELPGEFRWSSFDEYLTTLAAQPRTTNVAALVPHGPLRAAVLGPKSRTASAAEVAEMCALLDDALSAGGVGLSLGLMYTFGNSADPAELEALARVVGRRGKLLVAHLRNEGSQLRQSLDELVRLSRAGNVSVHVSHLKVTAPQSHGKMPEVIEILDFYRGAGVDLTADVYPYTAGSTTVSTLFPAWTTQRGAASLLDALRDATMRGQVRAEMSRPWGRLENYFYILGPGRLRLGGFIQPEHASLDGRSLDEIASLMGRPPIECLIELTLAEQARLSVVLFQMDERDMRAALAWPWTMIGSDGLPVESGSVHPRLYGTFPRILCRYADHIPGLSFAEAVRRMTSFPAARFGLRERGEIRVGAAADLVLLDRTSLRDTATYDDPRRWPSGVSSVLLNGSVAMSAGVRGDDAGAFLPTTRSGSTIARSNPVSR